MKLAFESHRAAVVLAITGDFTADDEDRFIREVKVSIENSSSNVILDCSKMTLIDSKGLESLLWLSDELHQNGNKLRLASISSAVQNVFVLTRLDRVFNSYDSVEAAARSFA
jgi:anti-sigma B factor antagonist